MKTLRNLAKIGVPFAHGGFENFSHTGRKGKGSPPFANSHSNDELDKGYKYHWEWFFSKINLSYLLPMKSGLDNRPWGGCRNSAHENSVSTPKAFESHLMTAKLFMNKYPEKSLKTEVICCWNEYGEGLCIEPIKNVDCNTLKK